MLILSSVWWMIYILHIGVLKIWLLYYCNWSNLVHELPPRWNIGGIEERLHILSETGRWIANAQCHPSLLVSAGVCCRMAGLIWFLAWYVWHASGSIYLLTWNSIHCYCLITPLPLGIQVPTSSSLVQLPGLCWSSGPISISMILHWGTW